MLLQTLSDISLSLTAFRNRLRRVFYRRRSDIIDPLAPKYAFGGPLWDAAIGIVMALVFTLALLGGVA